MKTSIARIAGAAAIALFASTAARAEVTQNESVDFTGFTVNVPCADGGAGEDVMFVGNLHILITLTTDAKGGVHIKTHFQPQGLQGVGLSTGAKYEATGVTQDESNVKVGQTYTFVNNFRMIGQGPGNNFLAHENYHMTVNAKGVVTVTHDNLSTECK